jgi:hypothetical protein
VRGFSLGEERMSRLLLGAALGALSGAGTWLGLGDARLAFAVGLASFAASAVANTIGFALPWADARHLLRDGRLDRSVSRLGSASPAHARHRLDVGAIGLELAVVGAAQCGADALRELGVGRRHLEPIAHGADRDHALQRMAPLLALLDVADQVLDLLAVLAQIPARQPHDARRVAVGDAPARRTEHPFRP